MNKTLRQLLMVAALGAVFSSCQKQASPDAIARYDQIVPKPVTVDVTSGAFVLGSDATIGLIAPNNESRAVGSYLAALLKPATGFSIKTEDGNDGADIVLELTAPGEGSHPEGYVVNVSSDQVRISATAPAGLFYGVQTLRQLLPPAIESAQPQQVQWEVSAGTITDKPAYGWRGSMLDVARHFFGMDDVKRYIDYLAMYKMNIIHLHLTDDQGWRIEIKSWPNLAVHGGKTEVGGKEGGFFTQEQYKELVAYAQARYMTLIPEIDMPGHINSALASYGELNGGTIVPEEGRVKFENNPILDGKQKPTELYTGTEVGWSTLRLEKPSTMKFVEDVIRELSAITPGPYIHIGGDEAHVTKKPDYIEFINRFSRIVKDNKKIMIGWEEIAQGDIDSSAVAQHWHEPNYARMAAEKGAKIIMSPSKKVYLDMQYDSTTRIGLHWAAYIEADDAYNWDPFSHVEGVEPTSILGVEAPLWGETIDTMDDIEYLLFPRITAVSELGWTPAESRSWESYRARIGNHSTRWKLMGIDYFPSTRVEWKP